MMLGNLSLDEMEKLAEVKFPQAFKDEMIKHRQQNISQSMIAGKWHCYHLPFELVLGGKSLIPLVKEHLVPLSSRFKKSLQVSVAEV